MAKSIALAADASRLASLLLSYIPAVRAFVAPRHPGASTAIIDRLSHSRALSSASKGVAHAKHQTGAYGLFRIARAAEEYVPSGYLPRYSAAIARAEAVAPECRTMAILRPRASEA
jgi:hypothetical protein